LTVTVAAVGRLRAGPIRDLCDDYGRRLPWPVTWREVEEKRRLPADALKAREGELLLAALPQAQGAPLVALDERGTQLSSTKFSEKLTLWREHGGGAVAFAIGGADGLHQSVLDRARFTLSLGAMTWPHMLVRALLMEQLWRAHSIATGHPYHRD
jgi:23S rRNA (pseudouridine1915-N3)-methyltransferase